MTQEEDKKNTLNNLYKNFRKRTKETAGYPLAHWFDYSKLSRFLNFNINNLGDPFLESNYKINTHEIERIVIHRFAKLFHAPENHYWGYVTNGGSEGNLYGLYLARELHPDGVVFYSDQTHYSVPKALKILRMSSVKVNSLPNGEIDYSCLKNQLNLQNKTPIILANIGTTMKGAVDSLKKIKEILSELGIKKYYIHCDAAFFGLILPFVPDPHTECFDFRVGIDSIAISGHKMIGTPVPCGVILTKKCHLENIGTDIEYTGAKDNTITGSRNGLTPLFLWHELIYVEPDKFEKRVKICLDNADYLINKFSECGVEAWRNNNSPIVVFPKPSQKIIKKWQLATEGPISHIITFPHLSHKTMDRIVKQIASDLKKRRRSKKV